MMDYLLLGLTGLATSMFAGITGLGGGMLLLASLPMFLPVHAIIPVHGVAQLASNLSRSILAIRHLAWQFLPAFLLGSLVGILLAWQVLAYIDAQWLPLCIGGYILCHVWWPAFKRTMSKYENFFIIGVVQTGLNPIVGATGPLTTTLVMARLKSREAIVSTNAILMSFSHISKIALFTLVGFEYRQYWLEVLILCLAAIAGSYLGTLVRRRIDGERFIVMLKVLLTLLAARMIITTIWQAFS
ncbi:MAG: sulfite exporter TauE/SafE family protein [Agarilytica sp.]